MGTRIQLQSLLETLLGSRNVYFQPPPSVKMKYPCIVYSLSDIDTKFADNNPYSNSRRYQLTAIDPNPDSTIPDKLALLPMCIFDRSYTADNLNHYAFNIYY